MKQSKAHEKVRGAPERVRQPGPPRMTHGADARKASTAALAGEGAMATGTTIAAAHGVTALLNGVVKGKTAEAPRAI